MRRYFTLVGRAIRLRCPLCGQGKLFRGWFRMHAACPHCGVSLEREPGFYLGSIYFNYGLTALLTAIAYPALMFNGVPDKYLVPGTLTFAVLFPLWFFRYARSLWVGFDQYWDPRKGEQGTGEQRVVKKTGTGS